MVVVGVTAGTYVDSVIADAAINSKNNLLIGVHYYFLLRLHSRNSPLLVFRPFVPVGEIINPYNLRRAETMAKVHTGKGRRELSVGPNATNTVHQVI